MMLAGWPDATVMLRSSNQKEIAAIFRITMPKSSEIKENPFIYIFSGLTVASEETSYSMGTRELGECFRETR